MRFQVKRGMVRPALFVSVGLIWACLILLGTGALLKYENRPAAPGRPPAQWPAASLIRPPRGQFVLVMMSHPDCPCTRASMVQLEELMARLDGRLAAFVLFSKPGAGE